MSEPLLDAGAIRRYVGEVAAELPAYDPPPRVVIVGGALMAWHDLRAATRDVDSVTRLDARVVDAVSRVAARHGLAPRWLNDSASGFQPATFDLGSCELLLNSP